MTPEFERGAMVTSTFNWHTATVCPNGHPMTGANHTRFRRNAQRSGYCYRCRVMLSTASSRKPQTDQGMSPSDTLRYLDLAVKLESAAVPWEREPILAQMQTIRGTVA